MEAPPRFEMAGRVFEIESYRGLRIRIDSALLLEVTGAAESRTCTVKAHVPRFVGVPPIMPVVAFNVSPGGSDPEVTDHFNGVVPPEAASAAE
jgi:hypothetical protein